MNKELHITDRIDNVLNILNSLQLSGYAQWNPVCEAMKQLASLSQDVQRYEAEHAEQEKPKEEAEPKNGDKPS